MNKLIESNDFLAEIFSEHPSIARFERFDLYDQIIAIIKTACEARLKLHITGAQVPEPIQCQFESHSAGEIRVTVKDGATHDIPVGTLLACFFSYDGCQGIFFTTLIGRGANEGGQEFLRLRTPFNIDLMESRLSHRIKLNESTPFVVKIRKPGHQPQLQPVEFGKNGIRLFTEEKLRYKVGDFVDLELILGEIDYPCRAQLRWSHDGNYGFCFEHVLSESPMRTPNAIERLFWSLEALESCGPTQKVRKAN